MPLTSMTGFAREAGHTGAYRWAWELRSVNGRGLDVRLRTPPGFEAMANLARERCNAAFKRGTIQVNLTVARDEAAPAIRINENALAMVLDAVARLPREHALGPLTLDGLLAVRGVVETVADEDGEEALGLLNDALAAALDRAVASLAGARTAEGLALVDIIAGQIARIAELTAAAETHPARTPEATRQRLEAQLATLLGQTVVALDPQRLHQEAVLIAARADIREELDRLKAHAVAAQALIGQDGSIGRRLDFLAQELAREANTLSAKAGDVGLNAIGLDLKTVVEQFREQVQNVE